MGTHHHPNPKSGHLGVHMWDGFTKYRKGFENLTLNCSKHKAGWNLGLESSWVTCLLKQNINIPQGLDKTQSLVTICKMSAPTGNDRQQTTVRDHTGVGTTPSMF